MILNLKLPSPGSYDNGLELIAKAVKKHPLQLRKDPAYREKKLQEILKDSGIKGTNVERYFSLQAVCMLRQLEPCWYRPEEKRKKKR